MKTHMTSTVASSRSLDGANKPAPRIKWYDAGQLHSHFIWIALIGFFLPPVPISIGDVTFTPARIIATLLLAPALATLLNNGRRRVAADFFAIAAAIWMIGSSFLNGGFRPYVAAEALDLLGAYLIGRAFFLGPANLQVFARVFEIVAIVVIAIALLDYLSERHVVWAIFGDVPSTQSLDPSAAVQSDPRQFRAASVFPNPIQYGSFCAAAAAIFFYSEPTKFRRIFFVGLSFFGCALALSSAPLLGAAVVAGSLCYDRVLQRYPWRWKLLAITVAGLVGVAFLVSDSPVLWIISHLTFNPATGYWRYTIWDIALHLISLSPWVGYGLIEFSGSGWWWEMFKLGVDCVWLVETIRYGVPCLFLLGLTIFSPFWSRHLDQRQYMDEMRTGLSLAIVALVLIGITVHFWDTLWIFFFLCVGIRASFAERATERRLKQSPVHAATREQQRDVP